MTEITLVSQTYTFQNYTSHIAHLCRQLLSHRLHVWRLCCQKQVSQAGTSNYIPQFTMGCNYLSLPEVPASGNKVLISTMGEIFLLILRSLGFTLFLRLTFGNLLAHCDLGQHWFSYWLSPDWCHVITSANTVISSIWTSGANFSENWIKLQ